jgi:hypothetical protein
MAEGENGGNPLFFVAREENPASLSIVKRESGGEVDPYEGGPIQKRETRSTTQPPPAGTKPGNTHSE